MLATFTPSIQGFSGLGLGLRVKRPLVRLALVFALSLALLPGAQAQAEDAPTLDSQRASGLSTVLAQQTTAAEPVFPERGRYLFGQVPQRDQLGHGYMVLESLGEEVFGALYYPSSSFDCFRGQIESGNLAMTITNSYTQETYPYSIALASDTSVASSTGNGLQPLNLQGFHQIEAISDNDLRLLETCRAAYDL